MGTVFATGAICILYSPTLIDRYFAFSTYVWQTTQVQSLTGFDPSSYSTQLQVKLAALQDLVHINTTKAAQVQKLHYDKSSTSRSFTTQELVWLSIPTAGKLQPRWEGKWKVIQMKSPVTVKITDGRRIRVVHINRVRHRNQPVETPEYTTNDSGPRQWHPVQTEHFILQETPASERHYPPRHRHPPVWFRP